MAQRSSPCRQSTNGLPDCAHVWDVGYPRDRSSGSMQTKDSKTFPSSPELFSSERIQNIDESDIRNFRLKNLKKSMKLISIHWAFRRLDLYRCAEKELGFVFFIRFRA